jgi:hypothetical protein
MIHITNYQFSIYLIFYNGLRIHTEVIWWLLQDTTLINTNDYKSQAEDVGAAAAVAASESNVVSFVLLFSLYFSCHVIYLPSKLLRMGRRCLFWVILGVVSNTVDASKQFSWSAQDSSVTDPPIVQWVFRDRSPKIGSQLITDFNHARSSLWLNP